MNILHLRSQYIVDGGVETFLLALFERLDRARFRHYVGVLTSDSMGRACFCEPLFASRKAEGGWERIRWDKRHLLVPTIRRVLKLIDEHRIDLVHSHDNRANILAFFVSRVMGRPLPWLASAHGWVTTPWKSRIIGQVDKVVIRSADRVHFAAPCLAGQIRELPPGRVDAVPYFIDDSAGEVEYDVAMVRRKWAVPPACVLLGMTGRLGPEKGHVHLLEAFARVVRAHSNVRLAIVGDGPLSEPLQELSRALGIDRRVVFTGYYPDALEACAAFDVMVHSSLSETLSIVILEALRLGKPLVATAVGANDEAIVPGRNGYLVPPGDPAAMADAILELLARPERIPRFAAASRALSRKFSSEEIRRRYESMYEALGRGGGPRSAK